MLLFAIHFLPLDAWYLAMEPQSSARVLQDTRLQVTVFNACRCAMGALRVVPLVMGMGRVSHQINAHATTDFLERSANFATIHWPKPSSIALRMQRVSTALSVAKVDCHAFAIPDSLGMDTSVNQYVTTAFSEPALNLVFVTATTALQA